MTARFRGLIAAWVAAAAFLVVAMGQARAAAPVNVALIFPLSGPNASVGEQSVNGAKLAAEEINQAGGIKSLGGAQLKLIVADSTNNPQGSVTTTERILAQHQLSAVCGMGISPLTVAAMPAMVRHHVPLVTNSIAEELITPSNGGYVFQVGAHARQFGEQQVRFLRYLNTQYRMNLTKAGVLYINNPYGLATRKGIEHVTKAAGLEVVFDSAYPGNITDASPLVARIQRSGAQVLFAASYVSDAQLILTALRGADSHILVIGAGGGYIWPPIGQALGKRVNGLLGVAMWNFNSMNVTRNRHLVEVTRRYARLYGTFMPEQAGTGYAGMFVIAAALERAASADPAKVRDALAKVDIDRGGATIMQPGRVAFGPNGGNKYIEPVVVQWQGGVPHTIFPETLATAHLHKP
jgi:branched-chain amino acid transport system substrate-binding protein